MTESTIRGYRALRRFARLLWDEFGGWGRTGLVVFILAMLAVIVMGFTIARAAEHDLLAARAELQSQLIESLHVENALASPSTQGWNDFDSEVRYRLLGGETVRVKVWDQTGTVVYSDMPELVGQSFDLDAHTLEAFAGAPTVEFAEAENLENATEQGLGDLIEYYIPVTDGGEVIAVFELYQTATGFRQSIQTITRDVWVGVLVGLGLLGLLIGSLIVANVHAINRRRHAAERMSDELMRVTESDRARIVVALHDDIGQPLYRILYGLQGLKARIGSAETQAELDRLEALVRQVDMSLRSELRILNRAALEEVGIAAAVQDLVDATHAETDLTIRADVGELPELASGSEAALFRAVQESLFNVRRHADARSVLVDLNSSSARVVARITDDGTGWNRKEGLGLATTRRALEGLGGGLDISSVQSGGTTVVAWVPVARVEQLV